MNTETREPHPLAQFGLDGDFKDNTDADVIVAFLYDWQCEEPETGLHRAATWFLFESEMAFYFACSEAGIDAEKLRNHLKTALLELVGSDLA